MKKKSWIPLLLCTAMLAGCAPQGSTTQESTAATTQPTETVVVDKYVALTFDDGPTTGTMNDVLDVLEQYGITATFFVVGKKINETTGPVLVRAVEMGCEIGNHSYSHTHISKMSMDEMLKDFQDTQDLVKQYTGTEPAFYRAPFYDSNETMHLTIPLPFIESTTGAGDGRNDNSLEERIYKSLNGVCDGAVIVLHCFNKNDLTVEALHTIIPELQKQGYGFMTVSQLFQRSGIVHGEYVRTPYRTLAPEA